MDFPYNVEHWSHSGFSILHCGFSMSHGEFFPSDIVGLPCHVGYWPWCESSCYIVHFPIKVQSFPVILWILTSHFVAFPFIKKFRILNFLFSLSHCWFPCHIVDFPVTVMISLSHCCFPCHSHDFPVTLQIFPLTLWIFPASLWVSPVLWNFCLLGISCHMDFLFHIKYFPCHIVVDFPFMENFCL